MPMYGLDPSAIVGFGQRAAPSLGNIACRMTVPQDFDTASKEASFRSWIPIPGGFSGPVVIKLPNAFIQGGTLFGAGGTTTFTASVEYVSGVRQQVLFSGVASGVAAPGTIKDSDSINIAVSAADGGFYFNSHLANASGIPRSLATIGSSDLGDGAVFSATTTPDLTMSGTVAFSSGYTYRPCAIVGMTKLKSVIFLDDSIGKGQGPAGPDFLGNNGIIERFVGAEFPHINCSSPGAKAQDLSNMAAGSGFGVLWQYNRVAQLGAGTNDIFLGARTGAQVSTDTATLAGKLRAIGLKVFSRTCLPQTTSTDTWATIANQTVKAQEAQRVALNTLLRSGSVTGVQAVWDITREVESGFDSGLWLPNFSVDGIHPSWSASEAVRNSGRISISAFRRS